MKCIPSSSPGLLLKTALFFWLCVAPALANLNLRWVRTLHAPELETRSVRVNVGFLNSNIGNATLDRAVLRDPAGRLFPMVRTFSSRSQSFSSHAVIGEGESWPVGDWKLVLFSEGVEWDGYEFAVSAPTAFPVYPQVPVLGYEGDALAIFLPSQPGTSAIRRSPGSVTSSVPGGTVYRYPNAVEPVFVNRATNASMPGMALESMNGIGPGMVGTIHMESEIGFTMNPDFLDFPKLRIARPIGASHIELAVLGTRVGQTHFLHESPTLVDPWISKEITPWSNALQMPVVITQPSRFFQISAPVSADGD